MKELNYWEQFLNTGSIEDYLRYKTTCSSKEDDRSERPTSQTVGENSYAGVCVSYGNDFKNRTCW